MEKTATGPDARARHSGTIGVLRGSSKTEGVRSYTSSLMAEPTQARRPERGLPGQKPAKRRRIASTSKAKSVPISEITNPLSTLTASEQGSSMEIPTYATVAGCSAGKPVTRGSLDAIIQAKVEARARIARNLAQTSPTPKDRLDAIIRAKVQARADTLRSPSVATPATPTTASSSASSRHLRPPRLPNSPASGGLEGSDSGVSGSTSEVVGLDGLPSRVVRSRRARPEKVTSEQPRQSVSQPSSQPAHQSDKAKAPPPQVSSSVPTEAWPRSGSCPTDDLSARIQAKIRARAEKAEHRRLSLGAGVHVTTTPPPAMDALTAKIHAKIQARAKAQAERLSQAADSAPASTTESVMRAARLSESRTVPALEPPSTSGSTLIGTSTTKTDNAKPKYSKQRKTRRHTGVDEDSAYARAPPPEHLSSEGLAAGPRSCDAGPTFPHMTLTASANRDDSGPDMFRLVSILSSDSESSDPMSLPSLRSQRRQPSLSHEASRTSSASVSDMLASSPGPYTGGGLSSPPSEMTFLIPSSPPPAATAKDPDASMSAADIASEAMPADLTSRWMHLSPAHTATVTSKNVVSSTPRLNRAGPRWTVTTPRL